MKKIKILTCCCCGNETKGRQWWNRDIGYGICVPCVQRQSKTEEADFIRSCYGEKGIHYEVEMNNKNNKEIVNEIF